MFYKDNNSAKLLNMEDVIVQKVENTGNELHVYMMPPRKMHKCPCCGSETNRIHNYRDQKIKDIPLGRTTYLGCWHIIIFDPVESRITTDPKAFCNFFHRVPTFDICIHEISSLSDEYTIS